jgi:hypothetical protein
MFPESVERPATRSAIEMQVIRFKTAYVLPFWPARHFHAEEPPPQTRVAAIATKSTTDLII